MLDSLTITTHTMLHGTMNRAELANIILFAGALVQCSFQNRQKSINQILCCAETNFFFLFVFYTLTYITAWEFIQISTRFSFRSRVFLVHSYASYLHSERLNAIYDYYTHRIPKSQFSMYILFPFWLRQNGYCNSQVDKLMIVKLLAKQAEQYQNEKMGYWLAIRYAD